MPKEESPPLLLLPVERRALAQVQGWAPSLPRQPVLPDRKVRVAPWFPVQDRTQEEAVNLRAQPLGGNRLHLLGPFQARLGPRNFSGNVEPVWSFAPRGQSPRTPFPREEIIVSHVE